MKSKNKFLLVMLVIVLVLVSSMILVACAPKVNPPEEGDPMTGDTFIYRMADSLNKKVGALKGQNFYNLSMGAYLDMASEGDGFESRKIRLDVNVALDLSDLTTESNHGIEVKLIEEKGGASTEILTIRFYGGAKPEDAMLYVDSPADNYPAVALTDIKPSVITPIIEKLNLNDTFFGIFKEDGMLSGFLPTVAGIAFSAGPPLQVFDDGTAIAEVGVPVNTLFGMVTGFLPDIENVINGIIPGNMPELMGVGSLIPDVLRLFGLSVDDIVNFNLPQTDLRLRLTTKNGVFEDFQVLCNLASGEAGEEGVVPEGGFKLDNTLYINADVETKPVIPPADKIDGAEEFSFTNLDIGFEFNIDNACDLGDACLDKANCYREVKLNSLLGSLSALFDFRELGERTLRIKHGVYGLKIRIQGDLDFYDNTKNKILINISDSADTEWDRPLIRIAYNGAEEDALFVSANIFNAKIKIPDVNLTNILNNALEVIGEVVFKDPDAPNKTFAEIIDQILTNPADQVLALKASDTYNAGQLDTSIAGGYTYGGLQKADINQLKVVPLIRKVIAILQRNIDEGNFTDGSDTESFVNVVITGKDIADILEMLKEALGFPEGFSNSVGDIINSVNLKLGAYTPTEVGGIKDTGLFLRINVDLNTRNYEQISGSIAGGKLGANLNIDPIKIGWEPNFVKDMATILNDKDSYIDFFAMDSLDVATSIGLKLSTNENIDIDLNKYMESFIGDLLIALNIEKLSDEIVLDVKLSLGLEYKKDGTTIKPTKLTDLTHMNIAKVLADITVKIKGFGDGSDQYKEIIKIYYDSVFILPNTDVLGALFIDASAVGLPKMAIPFDIRMLLGGTDPNPAPTVNSVVDDTPAQTPVEVTPNDELVGASDEVAAEQGLDVLALIGGIFYGIDLDPNYLAITLSEKMLDTIFKQFFPDIEVTLPDLVATPDGAENGTGSYIKLTAFRYDEHGNLISGINIDFNLALQLSETGVANLNIHWDGLSVSANNTVELPSDINDYPIIDLLNSEGGILDAFNEVNLGLTLDLKGGVNQSDIDLTPMVGQIIEALSSKGIIDEIQAKQLSDIIATIQIQMDLYAKITLEIDANFDLRTLLRPMDATHDIADKLRSIEGLIVLKGSTQSDTIEKIFASFYLKDNVLYANLGDTGKYSIEIESIISAVGGLITKSASGTNVDASSDLVATAPDFTDKTTIIELINNALGGVTIGGGGITVGLAQGLLDYIVTLLDVQIDLPDVSPTSGMSIKLFNDGQLAQINAHFGLIFAGSSTENVYIEMGINRLGVAFKHDAKLIDKVNTAFEVPAGGQLSNSVINIKDKKFINLGAEFNISLKQLDASLNFSQIIENFAPGFAVPIELENWLDLNVVINLDINLPIAELLDLLGEMKMVDGQVMFGDKGFIAIVELILEKGELALEMYAKETINSVESTYTFINMYYSERTAYVKSDFLGISGIKLTGVGDALQNMIEGAANPAAVSAVLPTSGGLAHEGGFAGLAEDIGLDNLVRDFSTNGFMTMINTLGVVIGEKSVKITMGSQVLALILSATGVALPEGFNIADVISKLGAELGENAEGEFELSLFANIHSNMTDVLSAKASFKNMKLQISDATVLPTKVVEGNTVIDLEDYDEISLEGIIDGGSGSAVNTFINMGAVVGFDLEASDGILNLTNLVNSLQNLTGIPEVVADILKESVAYVDFENKGQPLSGRFELRFNVAFDLTDLSNVGVTNPDGSVNKLELSYLGLDVELVNIDNVNNTETTMIRVRSDNDEKALFIDFFEEKLRFDLDLTGIINGMLNPAPVQNAQALALAGEATSGQIDYISLINHLVEYIKIGNLQNNLSGGFLNISTGLVSAVTLNTLFSTLGLSFIMPEIPNFEIGASIDVAPLKFNAYALVPFNGENSNDGQVRIGIDVGQLKIDAGEIAVDKDFKVTDYKYWDEMQLNVAFKAGLEAGLGSSKGEVGGLYPGNNINVVSLLSGLLGKDFNLDAIVSEDMQVKLSIDARIALDLNGFFNKGNDIIFKVLMDLNIEINGETEKLLSLYYNSERGKFYIDANIFNMKGKNQETTKIAVNDLDLASFVTQFLNEKLSTIIKPIGTVSADAVYGAGSFREPDESGFSLVMSVAGGVLKSALSSIGLGGLIDRTNEEAVISVSVTDSGFELRGSIDERTYLALTATDFEFGFDSTIGFDGAEASVGDYTQISDIKSLNLGLQFGFGINAGEGDLDVPFTIGDSVSGLTKNLILKLYNDAMGDASVNDGTNMRILAQITGKLNVDLSKFDELTIKQINDFNANTDPNKAPLLSVSDLLKSIELNIDVYSISADGSKELLMKLFYYGGDIYVTVPSINANIKLANLINIEEALGLGSTASGKVATAGVVATAMDPATQETISSIVDMFASITTNTSETVIKLSESVLTSAMELLGQDLILPEMDATITLKHPNSVGDAENNFGFNIVEMEGLPFGVKAEFGIKGGTGYNMSLEIGGLNIAMLETSPYLCGDIDGNGIVDEIDFDLYLEKFKSYQEMDIYAQMSGSFDILMNKDDTAPGGNADLNGLAGMLGDLAGSNLNINLLSTLKGKIEFNLEIRMFLGNIYGMEFVFELYDVKDDGTKSTILSIYYNGRDSFICLDATGLLNIKPIRIDGVNLADFLPAVVLPEIDRLWPAVPSENTGGGIAAVDAVDTVVDNTDANARAIGVANATIEAFFGSQSMMIKVSGSAIIAILEVLSVQKPVLDADGNPVIGEDGQQIMYSTLSKDIADAIMNVINDETMISAGIGFDKIDGFNFSLGLELSPNTKLNLSVDKFVIDAFSNKIISHNKEYTPISELKNIVLNASLGVNLNLLDGMTYDLSNILAMLFTKEDDAGNEVVPDVPSSVQTSGDVKGQYVLEISAVLNVEGMFADLDIVGGGGVNIEPLLESQISVAVRDVSDSSKLMMMLVLDGKNNCVYANVPTLDIKVKIDSSILDVKSIIEMFIPADLLPKDEGTGDNVTTVNAVTGEAVPAPAEKKTMLQMILGLFSSISIGNNGTSNGIFIETTTSLIQAILGIAGVDIKDIEIPDLYARLAVLQKNESTAIDRITLDLVIPHKATNGTTDVESSVGLWLGDLSVDFDGSMVIQDESNYVRLANTKFVNFGLKADIGFNSKNVANNGDLSLGLGSMINGLAQKVILDELFMLNIGNGLQGNYSVVFDANINVEFLANLAENLKIKDEVEKKNAILNDILETMLPKSELRIAIYDVDDNNKVVAEVMYLDGVIYADLSFFGLPKARIDSLDLSALLRDALQIPAPSEKSLSAVDASTETGAVAPANTTAEGVKDIFTVTLHADKIVVFAGAQFLQLIFASLGTNFVIDQFEFTFEATVGNLNQKDFGVGIEASLYATQDTTADPHTKASLKVHGLALGFEKKAIDRSKLSEFKSIDELKEISLATDITVYIDPNASDLELGDLLKAIFGMGNLGSSLEDIDFGLATTDFATEYNLHVELNAELDGFAIDFSNLATFDFAAMLKGLSFSKLEFLFELTSKDENGVVSELATFYYFGDLLGSDYGLIGLPIVNEGLKIRAEGIGLRGVLSNAINGGGTAAPAVSAMAETVSAVGETAPAAEPFNALDILKLLQSVTLQANQALKIDIAQVALTELLQMFGVKDFILPTETDIKILPSAVLNFADRDLKILLNISQIKTNANIDLALGIKNYDIKFASREIKRIHDEKSYITLDELEFLHIDMDIKLGYNVESGQYRFEKVLEKLLPSLLGDMQIPAIDQLYAEAVGKAKGEFTLKLQGNIAVNMPESFFDITADNIMSLFDLAKSQFRVIIGFQQDGKEAEVLIDVFVNGLNDELMISLPVLADTYGKPVKVFLSDINIGRLITSLIGRDNTTGGGSVAKAEASVNALSKAGETTTTPAPTKAPACGCTNEACNVNGQCYDYSTGIRKVGCTCDGLACLNFIDVAVSLLNGITLNGTQFIVNLKSDIYSYLLNLLGIDVTDINPSLGNIDGMGVVVNLIGGLGLNIDLGILSFGLGLNKATTNLVPIAPSSEGYESLNNFELISIDTELAIDLKLPVRDGNDTIKIGDLLYPILKELGLDIPNLAGNGIDYNGLEIAIPAGLIDDGATNLNFVVKILGNINLIDIDTSDIVINIELNNNTFLRVIIRSDGAMYLDAPFLGLYKIKLTGAKLSDILGITSIIPEGGLAGVIDGLAKAGEATALSCACTNPDCIANNSCYNAQMKLITGCNGDHVGGSICDTRYTIADLILGGLTSIVYNSEETIINDANGNSALPGLTINLSKDFLNKVMAMFGIKSELSLPISLNLNTAKIPFSDARDITASLNIDLYEGAYAKLSLNKFKFGLSAVRLDIKSLAPGEENLEVVFSEYTNITSPTGIDIGLIHVDTKISLSMLSDEFGIDLMSILTTLLPAIAPEIVFPADFNETLNLLFTQFEDELELVIKGNIDLKDLSNLEAFVGLVRKSNNETLAQIYISGAAEAVYIDAPMLNLRKFKLAGLSLDFLNELVQGLGRTNNYAGIDATSTALIDIPKINVTPEVQKYLDIVNSILPSIGRIEFSQHEGVRLQIGGHVISEVLKLIPGINMDLSFIGDIIKNIDLRFNIFESKLDIELGLSLQSNNGNGTGSFDLNAQLDEFKILLANQNILTDEQKVELTTYNELSVMSLGQTPEGIYGMFNIGLDIDAGNGMFDIAKTVFEALGKEVGTNSIGLEFQDYARHLELRGKIAVNTEGFLDISQLLLNFDVSAELVYKGAIPADDMILAKVHMYDGVLYIATDLFSKAVGGKTVTPKISIDIYDMLYGRASGISAVSEGVAKAGIVDYVPTIFSMIDSIAFVNNGLDVNFDKDILNKALEILKSIPALADIFNDTSVLPQVTSLKASFRMPKKLANTDEADAYEYVAGDDKLLSFTLDLAKEGETARPLTFGLNNMFATLYEVGNDGKPADDRFAIDKDLVASDYVDFNDLQGFVAGLTLDFEIRGKDGMIDLSDIFKDKGAGTIASPIIDQIASLFQNVMTSLNITTADLVGKYRADIKLEVGSLDFTQLNINSIKANIVVSKEVGANYTQLLNITLLDGIAYVDLAGVSYLPNVGKFKLNIVEFMDKLGVDIGGGTSEAIGTNALALDNADSLAKAGLDLQTILDYVALASGCGLIFGEDYVANVASSAIAGLLDKFLGLKVENVNASIGLNVKDTALRLDVDMANNNGVAGTGEFGFGLGLHSVYATLLGSNSENYDLVNMPTGDYADLLEQVVSIQAGMKIKLTSNGFQALIKDMATLLPGLDLSLIVDNGVDVEIKLSAQIDLCLNDFITDELNIKSKALINIEIKSGTMVNSLSIYTDMTALYLDLTNFGLTKIKVDLDLLTPIRGLLKGVFVDGFEQQGTQEKEVVTSRNVLATTGETATLACGCANVDCITAGNCYANPTCDRVACNGTCDIISMIADMVESISIGNQRSEIKLKNTAIATIMKALGVNIPLPEFTLSLVLDNTDKNGDGVDIKDAYMTLTAEAGNDLSLGLTLDGLNVGVSANGLLPAKTDLDTYTDYTNLELHINASMIIDTSILTGGNNGNGHFISLENILSLLLNNVASTSGIYAEGNLPSKIIANIEAYINLSELFVSSVKTKTMKFKLTLKEVVGTNQAGNTIIELAYDNSQNLLVVKAPAIGIPNGIAVPDMLDLVGTLRNAFGVIEDNGTGGNVSTVNAVDVAQKTATRAAVNPALALQISDKALAVSMKSDFLNEIMNQLGLSNLVPAFDGLFIKYDATNASHFIKGKISLGLTVVEGSSVNNDVANDKLGVGVSLGLDTLLFGTAAKNESANINVSASGALNISNLSQLDVTLGGSLILDVTSTDNKAITGPLQQITKMLAGMMGMDEDAITVIFNTTGSLKYDLTVNARIDFSSRENFNKNTQIGISIGLTTTQGSTNKSMTVASAYYLGEDNSIYIDLGNVGLPKIKLSGIDLFGMLSGLLGGSGIINSSDEYTSVVDYKALGTAITLPNLGSQLSGLKDNCGCVTCKDATGAKISCVKESAAGKTSYTAADLNCACSGVFDNVTKKNVLACGCTDAACTAESNADKGCVAGCTTCKAQKCAHFASIDNPAELMIKFAKMVKGQGASFNGTVIDILLNSGLIDQILAMAGLDFAIPKLNTPVKLTAELDSDMSNGTMLRRLGLFVDLSPENMSNTHSLTIELNQIKINSTDFSTGIMAQYVPAESERNLFSPIFLDPNNMDLGGLLVNTIQSLKASNNNMGKAMLEGTLKNSSWYVNSAGTISKNNVRSSTIKIGKGKMDNSGVGQTTNTAQWANGLRIYISTSGGNLSAFYDVGNWIRIEVESINGGGLIGGIAGSLAALKDIWITELNIATLLGGSSGSANTGTGSGDSTDKPLEDDDTSGGGATPPAEEFPLKGIEITIGGATMSGVKGDDIMTSSVKVDLAPSFLKSITSMINTAIIMLDPNGGGTPSTPQEQATVYLFSYILGMQSAASMLKGPLYNILQSLIPFPQISEAGGSGYLKLMFNGNSRDSVNNGSNDFRGLDQIRFFMQDTLRGEMLDLQLTNNGIELNFLDTTTTNINWQNNEQETARDVNPYALDNNSNGSKDYMENLPNTVNTGYYYRDTGSVPGGGWIMSDGHRQNVYMSWTDNGKLLDPTKSIATDPNNKIVLNGHAMNYRYDNPNKVFAYISPENVRRPVYVSHNLDGKTVKYPDVSGIGLSYPMIFNAGEALDLPSVVTVLTENEMGAKFPMTFNRALGHTVVWDTSELNGSYEGQEANIYLTYGNGNCRNVRISFPVKVPAKKIITLIFDENLAEGQIGAPLNFNPYTFKGLPNKVMALYEDSSSAIECDIVWNNAESVIPSYKGALYNLSARVGNNAIGYQTLNDIEIAFEQKQIAEMKFNENDAKYPFKPFIPYDTSRRIDRVTSYPANAEIVFTDGTTETLPLAWNLSNVNAKYDAGESTAVARIGSSADTYQQVNITVSMMDGTLDINSAGLNKTRYEYDAFANGVGSINTPQDAAWYGQNTTMLDFGVGERAFDITWDMSEIKLSYLGGTFNAYAVIGNVYSGQQRIPVPVVVKNRQVIDIRWTVSDAEVGRILSYPLNINPYTTTLRPEALPSHATLIFADGSTVDGHSITWNTYVSSVNYTGGATYVIANVNGGGVQDVRVPVKVQEKVISNLQVGPYEFDPYQDLIDPTSSANYANFAIAEFSDGTFMSFGAKPNTAVVSDTVAGTITWDLSNIRNFTYKGGRFTVKAKVGNSLGGYQNVDVPVTVSSRVVRSVDGLTNVETFKVIDNVYGNIDPRNPDIYPKEMLVEFENGITELYPVKWDLSVISEEYQGYKGGTYFATASIGNPRSGYQYYTAKILVADSTIKLDMLDTRYRKFSVLPTDGLQLPSSVNVDFGTGFVRTFNTVWTDVNDIVMDFDGNGAANDKKFVTMKIGNLMGGYQLIEIPVEVRDMTVAGLYQPNFDQFNLMTGYTLNPFDTAVANVVSGKIIVETVLDERIMMDAVWDQGNVFDVDFTNGDYVTNITATVGYGALKQTISIPVTVKNVVLDEVYLNKDDAEAFTCVLSPYESTFLQENVFVSYIGGTEKLLLPVEWKWADEVNGKKQLVAVFKSPSVNYTANVNINTVEVDVENVESNISYTIDPYNVKLADSAMVKVKDAATNFEKEYLLYFDWRATNLTFSYDGKLFRDGREMSKNAGEDFFRVPVKVGTDIAGYKAEVEVKITVRNMTVVRINLTELNINPYDLSTMPSYVIAQFEDNSIGRLPASLDKSSLKPVEGNNATGIHEGGKWHATLFVGNYAGGYQEQQVIVNFERKIVTGVTEIEIKDGKLASTVTVNFEDGTSTVLKTYQMYTDFTGAVAGDGKVYDLKVGTEFTGFQTIKVVLIAPPVEAPVVPAVA